MSRYFVTSAPANEYPYSLQDLRVRPPRRRRTGLAIMAVAVTSALCGGAAAYALMATGEAPDRIQLASVDSDISVAATAAALPEEQAKPAEVAQVEVASAEPVVIQPVKVKAVAIEPVDLTGKQAEVVEPAPLAANNPRWAESAPAPVEKVKQIAAVKALDTATQDIDVAETEADVVALEEQMSEEVSPAATVAYAAPEEEEPIKPVRISSPTFATGDLKSARATRYVNMRAAKNKYAAKLLVVPQNSEIRADPNCRHWCRVVYDGKLGYVYRTYIRFPNEASVAARRTQPAETEKKSTSTGLLSKLRDSFKPDTDR